MLELVFGELLAVRTYVAQQRGAPPVAHVCQHPHVAVGCLDLHLPQRDREQHAAAYEEGQSEEEEDREGEHEVEDSGMTSGLLRGEVVPYSPPARALGPPFERGGGL
jgi:hypothetical protein